MVRKVQPHHGFSGEELRGKQSPAEGACLLRSQVEVEKASFLPLRMTGVTFSWDIFVKDYPGAENDNSKTAPDDVECAAHVGGSDDAGFIVRESAVGVEDLGHFGQVTAKVSPKWKFPAAKN